MRWIEREREPTEILYKGWYCSETTGESWFQISTSLGNWTWVPCDWKQRVSPLDQWDMVRMKWDCRLSTVSCRLYKKIANKENNLSWFPAWFYSLSLALCPTLPESIFGHSVQTTFRFFADLWYSFERYDDEWKWFIERIWEGEWAYEWVNEDWSEEWKM